MKTNFLLSISTLFLAMALLFNSCGKDYSCTDGEQNQGETGIDCGGPCTACANVATCSDGIQNGGETGVDCGGSCSTPCSVTATCSDGIQNGTETGVDCGGTCPACSTSTCTDGIQNGTETGVDCGGTCSPCASTGTFTAKIDGVLFTATTVTAVNVGGKLNITASNATNTISLVHDGAFVTGNYPFDATAPAIYSVGAAGCMHNSGSITFTTFNTTTKIVSGSFLFACTNVGSAGTHDITEGTFANITYN